MNSNERDTDPDRFVQYQTPGAHEWWYFDALSDDGRDAIVLIWYSALPFDPVYGVATLRHLGDPKRYPQPNPLDHCAIGVSWHRDGKLQAYALNSYRQADFSHSLDPLRIQVAGNVIERDDEGYRLEIATPSVKGRRQIRASLRFRPARDTKPLERVICGGEERNRQHLWILAAPDCRVEGKLALEGKASLEFSGRGYHDHNAGAEDLTQAVRRWRWGRFHYEESTFIYYEATPQHGEGDSVWIECRDGQPVRIAQSHRLIEESPRKTALGIPYAERLRTPPEIGDWVWTHRRNIDWGPFYLRWLSDLEWSNSTAARTMGICESLDTRNLHRRLFNWMIPYRLKRPKAR